MIKIYNNKITYTSHRNKKSKVLDDELFKFLGEHVELDEEVTFKRIMELLKINEHLTDIVFAHPLGNYPFELFYEDFLKPLSVEEMKKYDYDYKKQHLEVHYYPDVFKYEKGERFEWNNSYDIHLIKTEKNKDIPYGIMFSKLGAFQKHKIRIKYEFDIHAEDSTKKVTRKSLMNVLLSAKLGGMKLFDFFGGILYEISWMGSPKDRDEKNDELSQRSQEIENGTAKLIPFNDVIEALKEKTKTKKKKQKK